MSGAAKRKKARKKKLADTKNGLRRIKHLETKTLYVHFIASGAKTRAPEEGTVFLACPQKRKHAAGETIRGIPRIDEIAVSSSFVRV